MSIEEQWKQVPGYEHYEVSNLGRIRRTSYLRPYSTKNQVYPAVQLFKDDGNMKKFFLHRLIAEAFIPNPDQKPFINHKDGNKLNYEIGNLEWVTASENSKHAYAIGLNKGGKSQQNRMVVQVGRVYEIVRIWNGVREIVASGFTWNKVYDSIKRGLWYRGHKWYYADYHYDYRMEKHFARVEGTKQIVSLATVEADISKRHQHVVKTKLIYDPPSRNKKSVVLADHIGRPLRMFSSILEAAKTTGADRAEIGRAIKTGKLVKGLKFNSATAEEYTAFITQTQQP